jgi:hypothetical protein
MLRVGWLSPIGFRLAFYLVWHVIYGGLVHSKDRSRRSICGDRLQAPASILRKNFVPLARFGR